MADSIHAFPSLLHHVWSLMLNEGNVHSCLVVSMRRKCKAEGCTQNICSCEFYLNEARAKRAISNIYLLKVTMEPEVLQARGGLWFIWSGLLHIPTHVLSPRLCKPTLRMWGQSKGDHMYRACICRDDSTSCAHAPRYCRCNVPLYIYPPSGLDPLVT